MLEQIKLWAIEQVLWAEKTFKGKEGAAKKAEVIKKLDDMIVLPPYLEWVDDMVLSWLVDIVCEKLNFMTGHDFTELELTEQQEQEIADEIEDPKKGGLK